MRTLVRCTSTRRVASVLLIACVFPTWILNCRNKDSAAPTGPVVDAEVVFETNKGKFVIHLRGDKAPISTTNFLRYVDEGFYNGTIFHRVIYDFMIQGGGFTTDLKEKSTHDTIANEATNGLRNRRGTVAMARTRNPNSAASQFFINVADNQRLDHRDKTEAGFGYAVIGEVKEGMDVIDVIRDVPTVCPSDSNEACTAKLPPSMRDVPEQAVIITKAYRR